MVTEKSIKPGIFIFIFMVISGSQRLYCQFSISTIKENKNSIKFFTAITPPLFFPLHFSASGGYEKFIDHVNAVELSGSYYLGKSDRSTTKIVSVYPGYNFYFRAVKNKGPYFRVGSYLKYSQRFLNEWGRSWKKYGAGMITGVRVNVSKNHKFTFDFAFGASIDYMINKHEYFLEKNSQEWMLSLRPQINFTTRF